MQLLEVCTRRTFPQTRALIGRFDPLSPGNFLLLVHHGKKKPPLAQYVGLFLR